MSENYLVVNGKKIELTEEQIKALGLEPKKDCFARVEKGEKYYYIYNTEDICNAHEYNDKLDDDCFKVANYCTDKELLKQRALHEILDRLLWRFSMQHEGERIDWNNFCQEKYYVYYDHVSKKFITAGCRYSHRIETHFYSKEIAQRAINEIILPFIKEHPEFVW